MKTWILERVFDNRLHFGDVFAIGAAFLLFSISIYGCKTNIIETPVGGVYSGSAYNPNAIGNPFWVDKYPLLAGLVIKVPDLFREFALVFAYCLYLTHYYTIPVGVLLYLLTRLIVVQGWRARAAILPCSIVTAINFPVLRGAVDVLMD
jgi:hypothetical protein